MKQTQLFSKAQKEAPTSETSKNAELLIRAGYIFKEMAGAYDFLPLGLRVLNKVINVIRQEMNALGAQEVFLTSLQNSEVWEKSGRWDDEIIDVWFKTKLKNENLVGLANTHEEPLANLVKHHLSSYKDLPLYIYQFQNKFRNELRAKSGILRGREFIMKDLYSFSRSQEELDEFYEKVKKAYENIFQNIGIGEKTFVTFASGGSFSKYSHEFQTVCPAGEDTIFIEKQKNIAVNKEVFNPEVIKELGINEKDLIKEKAIEVGNIFKLGTKYSQALGLSFMDEKGESQEVFMGSYGIGPARAMGTVAELHSDEKGLAWPESIAPFQVHILSLNENEKASQLYEQLEKRGIEALLDDRQESAGVKFAEADLIGIPFQIIVSSKNSKEDKIEVKNRKTGESIFLKNAEELIELLKDKK